MTAKLRIYAPAFFLLAIMLAFGFKSMVLAIGTVSVNLFYIAALPKEKVQQVSVLFFISLLSAFFICYIDHETTSFGQIFQPDMLCAVAIYAFPAFCILSSIRLLSISPTFKYIFMFVFAAIFSALTQYNKADSRLLFFALFFFCYLAGIYSLAQLIGKIKMPAFGRHLSS